MSYNCIEDAVDLGLELIDGYLGVGTDFFDINVSLPSEFGMNSNFENFSGSF